MDSKNKEKLFLKPCVVVLSGVPLTGKTVLAEKLVALSNLEMIDVDVVRNEIDESRKKDGQIKMLKPMAEKAIMIRAYTELCRQAENNVIDKGIPTIITGTFARSEFKEPLERLVRALEKRGIPLKVFLLTAPDEEILKRIEKRRDSGSLSNIDSLEKYRWAKRIFRKIRFASVVEIDTSKSNYIEQTIWNLEDLNITDA